MRNQGQTTALLTITFVASLGVGILFFTARFFYELQRARINDLTGQLADLLARIFSPMSGPFETAVWKLLSASKRASLGLVHDDFGELWLLSLPV